MLLKARGLKSYASPLSSRIKCSTKYMGDCKILYRIQKHWSKHDKYRETDQWKLIDQINSETWRKTCQHVEKTENDYLKYCDMDFQHN